MMRKAIRILCIALVLSVIGSLAVGCTPAATPTTATSPTQGPARTLTVEVFDRSIAGLPPVDDNYWTKWINKEFGSKYNAVVQFIPLPRGQEVDKLNILMAANQAPDIVFTYDQGVISNYIQQGGLTQLDDLVAQYGDNFAKYRASLMKYGQFGGKTYAIPGKMTVLMMEGSFIRKDWLDKLGLPLPTTVDELYNTLVAFRDKNPGGVDGVVPMAYAVSIANMADAFLQHMDEATIAKYQINQVEILWGMDGYKDCMRFMNKLYNEHLISPDFATDKDWKQAEADLSSGKAGFYNSNWDNVYRSSPGIAATLATNVPGAQLVPVDPYQSPDGKHHRLNSAPNAFYIVVPKTSKVPDLAVQYLNWMSDPKVVMFLQNGEQGVDYDLVDGIPVRKSPSTLVGDKQISVSNNIDICITTNGPETGDDALNLKAVAFQYPGFEKLVEQAAKIASTDPYFPFYFEKANTAYSKYGSTLYQKSLEMWAQVISCPKDEFDALYDKLVVEYMAAGGQAIIDENIKNYEEQTGKKIT